ncbi:hypothetical protein P9302_26635 [Brevibacillus agri]|uniref:hypothetical protein n=1 Tax=Brevibacillus agri TaxID=51101 RepID=UPI0018CC8C08|nr:hypothetical protein [Brevibacillus agri]MBG9564400.1 hypothetical protein [Brevibacillus agri]MED4572985.1 hypothetical protein [Brevibacillus agri]WHX29505.1 hypothetical protein QNK09_20810 [Brevibacillus agri]
MRDYYLLTEDRRISRKVQPSGLSLEGGMEALLPITVLEVQAEGVLAYPDWLERPIVMLSDRMKSITAKYNLGIRWKRVDLIDRQQNDRNVYWLMQVPAVDVLAKSSEFHQNGALKRMVLDYEKAKKHHFFSVQGILEPYIVVSLDAAESFLRRGLTGFVLQKVEIEPGREI